MENIEYTYIIGEMRNLIGLRFEKIQKTGEEEISIKVGKEKIVIELGKRMNISYFLKEGENEKGFIEKIRKELGRTRLDNIYQHNNDRIIVFEFSNEKKYLFIFEMFGKGNAILVCNNIILACKKNESWSDRKIKVNEEYKFPKTNIVDDIREAISEKYIISSMMRLAFGKKYSKEILQKCNINEKTPGNSLTKNDIEKINVEIKKLKENLIPHGFYENDKIVGFGLANFAEFQKCTAKKFDSLSRVIDEYYKNFSEIETESEKTKKLQKRLIEQENQLLEFSKEEQEQRNIGDKIYENYEKLEEFIKKERGKPKIEIEL